MRPASSIAAAVALLATSALAQTNYLGFNSGNTMPDKAKTPKVKKDWVAEFTTAQNLEGAPGKFNAVRLYSNIQAGPNGGPIQAFDAAIETKTYILLGAWASGVDNIDHELDALEAAVEKHGSKLTDLIIGISIGSEDLYRVSVTGIKNKSGVGNGPDAIVKFINDYKKRFASGPLASIPIGHVDTWDVWTNSSNKAVIDAVDFVGVDEYPYYEDGKGNHISNSGQLFDRAYDAVKDAVGDKDIWMTETGWPYIGDKWDQAEASVKNAQYYWQEVGCRQLFGKVPTFWYTLRDSNPDNTMKFAITENLSTEPMFDLTCPTTFKTPEASQSAGGDSPAASSTGASAPNPTSAGSSGGSNAGTSTEPSSSAEPSDSAAGLGQSLSYAAVVAALFAAML